MRIVFLTMISLAFMFSYASAGDRDPLVQLLIKKGVITKEEVSEMEEELKKQEEVKKEELTKKDAEYKRVDLDKITSKLKLKGRWAAGYLHSQESGSFPEGSFELPDIKLQFTFQPDDTNSITARMSLNNAAFQTVDYLFIDSKLFNNDFFTLNSRLGRFKLDLGEETWSDNPVESVLPSNSASRLTGIDEGIQLSGNISSGEPLKWSLSLTNGTSGVGSDTTGAKAVTGKIAKNIFKPLYLSLTYYNSFNLKASNSDVTIAGLATPPTGATKWSREVLEIDLRYDFCKGKLLNPPAYSDSKAFIRLAYGQFTDDAKAASDREGNYGFIEGTYNLTKRLYLAARYSAIDLEAKTTASLNGVTANRLIRTSLGFGYRLSGATILKTEYSFNDEDNVAGGDPDNDLVSCLIASSF